MDKVTLVVLIVVVVVAVATAALLYPFSATTRNAMCREYDINISVPDAKDEDLNALIKKLVTQFLIEKIETKGNCTYIRGSLLLNSTYVVKDVNITWCNNRTAFVSAVIIQRS